MRVASEEKKSKVKGYLIIMSICDGSVLFLSPLNNVESERCNSYVNFLRAVSPKYQLDLEIAKKSSFFKLAQNEVLQALVSKILF